MTPAQQSLADRADPVLVVDEPTGPLLVLEEVVDVDGPDDVGAAPVAAPAGGGRRRAVGIGLTAVGIAVALFVLHQLVLTDLTEARDQRRLRADLATSIAAQTAPPVGPGSIERGVPVALLEIPAIGLQKVVVEGAGAEALKSGPGHVRSTPLPGQAGNAVIAGRRTTYGQPFAGLDELSPGDEITATTGLGRFTYEVDRLVVVGPGDDDVIGATAEDRLTLVTSSPAYVGGKRLAVQALLVDDPVATTQLVPNVVDADEVGFGGDRGGLLGTIVWGQLLLLAGFATAWLYRRWAPLSTWLLTTPVLLALLLLVFRSVDRLLPATL